MSECLQAGRQASERYILLELLTNRAADWLLVRMNAPSDSAVSLTGKCRYANMPRLSSLAASWRRKLRLNAIGLVLSFRVSAFFSLLAPSWSHHLIAMAPSAARTTTTSHYWLVEPSESKILTRARSTQSTDWLQLCTRELS